MSDQEGFLARWSRRKQQTAHDAEHDAREDAERTKPAADASNEPGDARATADQPPGEPAFDVASLPSIDSITAESDIRAFLAPGVPPELTRAALRRAWSADPKIRDFVGLADYAWDFNTPGSVSGFGAIEMSDVLRRELARMVGRSLVVDRNADPVAPSEQQSRSELSRESGDRTGVPATAKSAAWQDQPTHPDSDLHNSPSLLHRDKDLIATQNGGAEIDNGKLIIKRSHGRALPK